MADEARLNDLLDLVEQARSEGDKDTEAKAVAAYKRESIVAKAGGGRPGGDAHQQIAVPELTEAEKSAEGKSWNQGMGDIGQWKQAAGNVGKLGLTTATSAVANAAGLLSKYGRGWGWLLADYKGAEDTKQKIQNALTYRPKNQSAQDLQETVGHYPGKAMGAVEKYGGTGTRDFVEAAMLAEGVRTPIARLETPKVIPRPKPIPTTQELTSAAREAYGNAKESGVIVPAANYNKAVSDIRQMATEEGIDPTLHPKSTAVMKRLEASSGKDLTLQEAETLRKIALDAEDDVNSVGKPTADARVAGKIVDGLDEKIEALSTNDEARALWSRSRRSQLVDTMIDRAEIKAGAHYTQAGMEHALRQEFKTLALNPRRMRGLNAEQRAAIEKVAKGGPIENTLRTLGKFDPTAGVVPALATIATGGTLAGLGFISRRLATRATKANVEAARESLVGRGKPVVTPAKRISPAMQTATRMAGDLGLGEYQPPAFQPSGGVIPSRAAIARAMELESEPVANQTQLPPTPSRMSADAPSQTRGDIEFSTTPLREQIASELSLTPESQRYPGSIDFTPSQSPMASQMAGDLKLSSSESKISAPTRSERVPTVRDIRAEIQSIEKRIRAMNPEQANDPMYVSGLSQEWKRLQAELALRAPRKAAPSSASE